jgi:hypothetical protein
MVKACLDKDFAQRPSFPQIQELLKDMLGEIGSGQYVASSGKLLVRVHSSFSTTELSMNMHLGTASCKPHMPLSQHGRCHWRNVHMLVVTVIRPRCYALYSPAMGGCVLLSPCRARLSTCSARLCSSVRCWARASLFWLLVQGSWLNFVRTSFCSA